MMEIFSGGMRGVSVGSMLPAAYASLGNITGPTSGVGGFRDTTGKILVKGLVNDDCKGMYVKSRSAN